ncbi:ribonuclease H-like [Centruroides vittatus]|uniref:ribonuclease H-like n=1 Tax=Centruroides vittatus TaxID=120091 RepID=UPI00350F4D0A
MEIHPAERNKYEINLDYDPAMNSHYQWLVYTYGSRQDNGTGAGIFITKNNTNKPQYQASIKLADYCSNNQAELKAVHYALTHITANLEKYKGKIKFFTDSRATLQTLNKENNTTILGGETIKAAQNLASKIEVHFSWIPAHKGEHGNEKADFLAKKAANSNNNV